MAYIPQSEQTEQAIQNRSNINAGSGNHAGANAGSGNQFKDNSTEISRIQSDTLEAEKNINANTRKREELSQEQLDEAIKQIDQQRKMYEEQYNNSVKAMEEYKSKMYNATTDEEKEEAKSNYDTEKKKSVEAQQKIQETDKAKAELTGNKPEDSTKTAKGMTSFLENAGSTLFPVLTTGFALYGGMELVRGVGGSLLNTITGGLVGGNGSGGLLGNLMSTMESLIQSVIQTLNSAVDDAVDIYSSSMGKVNARLYGDTEGVTFQTLMEEMRTTVGSSRIINQQQMIQNLVQLTTQGIDYNLEQRALLLTLTEDLVPTFNSLNDNLTRAIRMRQSDLTLAQMGSEARLNQFLNSVFKDSSYLDRTYDSVYGAITDALATQADTDQYTQLAYTVQKWLGGLYSVGLSDSAINNIANAINLLGTGDINKLGDSSANTLMAMVANRAGLSYTSLLTEGINSDTTNRLMKSMVEYLQDIATNTSSNVVKSQWGDILNLEMSDWKAIQTMTVSDISNIYNSVVDQMTAETTISSMIENVLPTRIHTSEMINNAIDNTMLSFGMGIADNTEKYVTWKLLNIASGLGNALTTDGSGASAIVNLLSGVGTFVTFMDDIMAIPTNIISLLTKGDNAIANIMAGYQANMNRGNMSYDTAASEGVSYNISNSSDTIVLSGMPGRGGESTVYEGIDGYYGGSGRTLEPTGIDTEEEMNYIESSSAEAKLTTFNQQDEYKSATAQNVISKEAVLVRDINDLYSELFEKQTTPIRVAIAKVEDAGKTDLFSSIDGISVSVSGSDDVFSGIASMRG